MPRVAPCRIITAALAAALLVAPSALALPLPPAPSPPTLSGTPVVGQAVTCLPGASTPLSAVYSWQLNGTAIPGANAASYVPTSSQAGQALTCTVTIGVVTLTSNSLPVAAPSPPGIPVNTGAPQLSGAPAVGQAVSCLPGSWTNGPTSYVYSWQLNGTNIPSANASSFVPTQSDAGQALSCSVAAANSIGASLPVASPPITVPGLPGGTGTGGSGSGSGTGTGKGSGGGPGTGGGAGSGSTGGRSRARSGVSLASVLAISFAPARVILGSKRFHRTKLKLSYRIDRAAAMMFVFGRYVGGEFVVSGMLGVKLATAGRHWITIPSRITTKLRKAGHYYVGAAAATGGGWSKPRFASLAIVARHRGH